jgi:aspartyl-tRNA(Asn)/glutamyl-tRNA(Gln) amidotransferase subunit C
MAKITADEIKNLFSLARLPFDDARAASAQKDMEEILGYVANLSRLDTSAVEEVHGGTDFLNAFRVDEVKPATAAERDAVIKSFPKSEADMNKVPSILGK